MFEFIKGNIFELSPTFVIIENNGIGYNINISVNTYTALSGVTETMIYIHQVIKEDSNALFGFTSKEEREVFRLLISVSGIGPNTARMMLSSMTYIEIQKAIATEDVGALKSIKGIGAKTAQRVIIDLKEKIGAVDTQQTLDIVSNNNVILDEAEAALVMLGFVKAKVRKVLISITKKEAANNVEDLIKKALKMM